MELSIIRAFTPSALAAVLLCAEKDDHHDYASIYSAMRRHLSVDNADRLCYDDHGFTKDWNDNSSPNIGVRTSI